MRETNAMVPPLDLMEVASMVDSDEDGSDKSVLDVLRDVMEGEASRRSRLDRWMTANYEGFSALLEGHRPNWAKLTEVFESLGFGEDGKPLGGETVRLTWFRVRKRREGKDRRRRRVVAPAAMNADVVREVPREMAGSSGVAGHRPRVAPVRPTMPMVPVEDVSHRAASEPEPSGGDRDAVLRALNDQFNAGRGKMPDPIK
jgi:hypothetical protein